MITREFAKFEKKVQPYLKNEEYIVLEAFRTAYANLVCGLWDRIHVASKNRLCHMSIENDAVSMRSALRCLTIQPNLLLSAEKPLSELFRLKYSFRCPNVSDTNPNNSRFHFQEPLRVTFFFGMM